MSNVIPLNKARTCQSLSKLVPSSNDCTLAPDEVLASAEELRDQMVAVTLWLESIHQELAAH